jgi:hypothetical protein
MNILEIPDELRVNSRVDSYLRRLARSGGYRLERSRERTYHTNNRGGYQLVDSYRNEVIAGCDYGLTAKDVSEILTDAVTAAH